MDAIVIACTTRSHVNLLNNEAAMSKNNAVRYQLSRKLRRYEDTMVTRNGETRTISVAREFLKPWPTFNADVEKALRGIVVSFKQNLRVINKTVNKYQKFVYNEEKHIKEKKAVRQEERNGRHLLAIRKPMHKDTVYGEVNLRRIKEVSLKDAVANPKAVVDKDLKKKLMAMIELGYDLKQITKYFEDNKDAWQDVNLKKIKVYYFTKDTGDRYFATRFGNDLVTLFSKITDRKNAEKQIERITDTGIQKILKRHLEANGGDCQKAFSADGIDEMNRNITQLNGGRPHKPVYKVRIYEKADKFAIGTKGNKAAKFVEAAKGTNLFFAVYLKEYEDSTTGETIKKRVFDTIPLKTVIDRLKNGQTPAPEEKDGAKLLFVLSPNDLVYLPTEDEVKNGTINRPLDKRRIYKMVDSSKSLINFVPQSVAKVIYSVSKEMAKQYSSNENNIVVDEFGLGCPKSKNERAITGEMIKEKCVPIKVDRLGNITEVNNEKI